MLKKGAKKPMPGEKPDEASEETTVAEGGATATPDASKATVKEPEEPAPDASSVEEPDVITAEPSKPEVKKPSEGPQPNGDRGARDWAKCATDLYGSCKRK
jgi:hypothetical protein